MRQLLFRESYFRDISMIEDADQRLEAYEAIMCYAFDEEEPEKISPIVNPILGMIFDSIDQDIKKYERKVKEAQEKEGY